MNYFRTKRNIPVTVEMDHCDHLKVGAIAHKVSYEMDSFGPVGAYALCHECATKDDLKAANEMVACHDCRQEVARKFTIAWKQYDFCESQGDEPTIVCERCQEQERHRARVEKDDREYRQEAGCDYDEDWNEGC